MKTLKWAFLLLFVLFMLYLGYAYRLKSAERTLTDCIYRINASLNIENFAVAIDQQQQLPAISGKANAKQQQQLRQLLAQNCQVRQFVDWLEKNPEFVLESAKIHFTLDGFNQIAQLNGTVNNLTEKQQILANFTDAVQTYYGEWTINAGILISKKVAESEFASHIAMLFPAILPIKVTDITLTNKQLIVKGLVRNEQKHQQTLSQLSQIFYPELSIIDQLEAVNKAVDDVQLDFSPQLKKPELPPLSPLNSNTKESPH